MAWLQVKTESRHPEFAEELMSALGAQAISYVDAVDDPVFEPAPGETPLWRRTVCVGLFAEDVDLALISQTLRSELPEGDELQLSSELIEDQDWVRVWLKDCVPLKFGDRLWVCPQQRRVDEAGCETLLLDPGLAFGTGTHPTTALCLEWLAQARFDGARVLDFGCGSGILAIAALKLGAGHALAYDIDPQALIATRSNAEVNAVSARLQAIEPGAALPAIACDIVLANILARPLIELAAHLVQQLAVGGRIVLSGILDRQADEVRAAYQPWIDFDPDVQREGWSRLSGVRRAG